MNSTTATTEAYTSTHHPIVPVLDRHRPEPVSPHKIAGIDPHDVVAKEVKEIEYIGPVNNRFLSLKL